MPRRGIGLGPAVGIGFAAIASTVFLIVVLQALSSAETASGSGIISRAAVAMIGIFGLVAIVGVLSGGELFLGRKGAGVRGSRRIGR